MSLHEKINNVTCWITRFALLLHSFVRCLLFRLCALSLLVSSFHPSVPLSVPTCSSPLSRFSLRFLLVVAMFCPSVAPPPLPSQLLTLSISTCTQPPSSISECVIGSLLAPVDDNVCDASHPASTSCSVLPTPNAVQNCAHDCSNDE